LEPAVRAALEANPTVDITITRRRSGTPHRLEIWVHAIEDRVFLTGSPGARSWYANLLADPRLTLHVKHGASADIPMRARAVTTPEERAELFPRIVQRVNQILGPRRERDHARLDDWLADSRLLELTEE
jgi:hypothetical protein